MPPRHLAHLDPHFAQWLELADKLLARAGADDRFVILPSDISLDLIRDRLASTHVASADLIAEPGLGDHSLLVIYDKEVDEHDRFLMLASRRFMLELSFDQSQQLRWQQLIVFHSDRDGMPFRLWPWSGRTDDMLVYLWQGVPIETVELD